MYQKNTSVKARSGITIYANQLEFCAICGIAQNSLAFSMILRNRNGSNDLKQLLELASFSKYMYIRARKRVFRFRRLLFIILEILFYLCLM